MAKIPFKVSARTALLIGRENVASAKGALIELVKNCYDADSPASIIHFDNLYALLQPDISFEYVNELISRGIDEQEILAIYDRQGERFLLKPDPQDKQEKAELEQRRQVFKKQLNKLNAIYILDFGEGMTKSIIENYWMTIGTDNKLSNVWTTDGRVKAGAKGIGRFALDRLGGSCEMITFFSRNDRILTEDEQDGDGYQWQVNWNDFDTPTKTISDVDADLQKISASKFIDQIEAHTKNFPNKWISEFDKKEYGTLLKISDLRDYWDDSAVERAFSDLEVLVPPKETEDFRIIVSSALNPNKYGEVLSTVCDDFDYKLFAKADKDQNINITLYRNEYDIESIPDAFFRRPAIESKKQYSKQAFTDGSWSSTLTFGELLPGFSQVDEEGQFSNIGPFEFSLYFLKRASASTDSSRFFYRRFMSNNRKDWLSKFGGIKLFRDNFRVRPYGETNDVAFDWLGLGSRKAASPAGVAKSEGGYRIEPENVAGAIKISRLTNLNFEDKSSREGLQENNTFKVFKTLIAGIIKQLEEDRSYIAREMAAFDNERFGGQREMEAAEALAKKLAERAKESKNKNENGNTSQAEQPSNDSEGAQATTLAHLVGLKNEQIERLEEEQKLLRGLASSGIVSAAFGHDLSKLSDNLDNRIDKLMALLIERISEKEYSTVERRKNPFELLKRMKGQDIKIQNWLNFSLGFTRKDKRKRKQLVLDRYFNEFSTDWSAALDERLISLHIDAKANLEIRAFEIDFDSIFSNLLVNSIDAFINSKLSDARAIYISCGRTDKELIIEYRDTGPGLNKDILQPEKIFEPLFTTKRNTSGEEIGTGLGMWIIKSVVEENSGVVKLLYPAQGFGVRITFPLKYKAVI